MGDERGVRVGLFGRLGSGNLGNDASMEAILAFLKAEAPEAVIDCLCSGPERLIEHYGLPAEELQWLHAPVARRSRLLRRPATVLGIGLGALIDAWRISAWVRRHDVVIVPGMGVFESDLQERPWQLPYAQFILSAAGRIFRVKVAFVSVGATVVEQRLTGRLLASAARLAHYRSFRDEHSLNAASQMRMTGSRDQVYPDLVFALPTPGGPTAPTGSVGVGVMAYHGGPGDRHHAEQIRADYTAKMTRFVRRLAAAGRPVRLLIGDADDEPVALEILAGLRPHQHGPDNVQVRYDRPATVDELMQQLCTVEVVVGARFHTVLTALKLAKPTVAIAYGQKHAALMAEMGVGDLIQNIKELDVDRLERQLEEVRSDRDRIVRLLAERSRLQATRLDDQFAELTAALFEDTRFGHRGTRRG